MSVVFEKYGIAALILEKILEREEFNRTYFEEQCLLLSQRTSFLQGVKSSESNDRTIFRKFIEALKGTDSMNIESVKKLGSKARTLLSKDILHSIERL